MGNIWELTFQLLSPFDFTPGQYTDITVPSLNSDTTRTFSIISLPSEPQISILTKLPTPHSSFKQALFSLKPGDSVNISQPMGDLVLPRDDSRPLTWVAGGIGIASYVSMAKYLSMSGSGSCDRQISLFYAHKPEEALYDDVMANCPGLRQLDFVSPSRITVDDIIETTGPRGVIYLSGSEEFTLNYRNELMSSGINPTQIVYDYFTGYQTDDL